MSLNRIDPNACREIRKNQAEASLKCVGYDYLSSQDRQQIDRLLYVDDLADTEYKQTLADKMNERLKHLDDIAVSLGYKPTELYKPHVLNAVMKVRSEEYAKEINAKIEAKKRSENRLGGANLERMRQQEKEKFLAHKQAEVKKIEQEPQSLSEFTNVQTMQGHVEPSVDEINAILAEARA